MSLSDYHYLYTTPEWEKGLPYTFTFFACLQNMSLFFICFLYFWSKSTPELAGKYVSTIHATVLVLGSSIYLYGMMSVQLWQMCQIWPISYLLYDMIVCLPLQTIPRKTRFAMYIHHITFLAFTFFVFPYEPRAVTMGYLCESVIPFLNMFFHYKHLENTYPSHNTNVYANIYASITLVLWPFCRLANLSYLTYFSYFVINNIPMTVGVCLLTILNYYWYYKMLSKFCV